MLYFLLGERIFRISKTLLRATTNLHLDNLSITVLTANVECFSFIFVLKSRLPDGTEGVAAHDDCMTLVIIVILVLQLLLSCSTTRIIFPPSDPSTRCHNLIASSGHDLRTFFVCLFLGVTDDMSFRPLQRALGPLLVDLPILCEVYIDACGHW